MSDQHSPGPWRWRKADDYSRVLLDAKDSPLLPPNTDGEGVNVDDANARLIAAAPEMLALLQWWAERHRGTRTAGELDTRLLLGQLGYDDRGHVQKDTEGARLERMARIMGVLLQQTPWCACADEQCRHAQAVAEGRSLLNSIGGG